jgi:hypothetical protein
VSTIAPAVKALASAVTPLVESYLDAETVQWSAAPATRARADTTERSKGVRSDPTPAIALDEKRLRVRAAVIGAERAIEDSTRVLREADTTLRQAVAEWRGSDVFA